MRAIFLGAGFAMALLAAPAAQAQSLADTLIAAYRSSNLLDQNRALLRAADEDVAIAVAAMRPVVSFAMGANQRIPLNDLNRPGRDDSLSLSFDLGAEITLIDFGRGQLAKEAAKAIVLATRHALVDVEQNVLLNAVRAHLDVRTATESVALQRATLGVIDQEVRAARDRFELGENTRTDVSLAEARLAGARSILAAAEGDLAAAREAYKLATGAYPATLRAPPALPATARSLDLAQEIARQTHPAIRQAQQEVIAADLNAERVGKDNLGSVTGTASISQGFVSGSALSDTRSSRDASLGIRYSRPLYQGGRDQALHRRAIAQRDARRAGLHQVTAQVLQNVGVAWSTIDVARARISAAEQQIRAATSAFEGTREEARLGARTTLDVLNAENDLRDARNALLTAQASLQFASYNLLSAMGLMTVEHLNLGIPTYDPEAYFNAVKGAPSRSPQGQALDRVLQRIGRP